MPFLPPREEGITTPARIYREAEGVTRYAGEMHSRLTKQDLKAEEHEHTIGQLLNAIEELRSGHQKMEEALQHERDMKQARSEILLQQKAYSSARSYDSDATTQPITIPQPQRTIGNEIGKESGVRSRAVDQYEAAAENGRKRQSTSPRSPRRRKSGPFSIRDMQNNVDETVNEVSLEPQQATIYGAGAGAGSGLGFPMTGLHSTNPDQAGTMVDVMSKLNRYEELRQNQHFDKEQRTRIRRMMEALVEELEKLGCDGSGRCNRDLHAWIADFREKCPLELMKEHDLRSKLLTLVIDETKAVDCTVDVKRRKNWRAMWVITGQSNNVKLAQRACRDQHDRYIEYMRLLGVSNHEGGLSRSALAPVKDANYAEALNVFLSELAGYLPREKSKVHMQLYPPLRNYLLEWRSRDSSESPVKLWERFASYAAKAREIMREEYRKVCNETLTTFVDDDSLYFIGLFSVAEGDLGYIKHYVTALPKPYLNHMMIGGNFWPTNAGQWTWAYLGHRLSAYHLSIQGNPKHTNNVRYSKQIISAVNALTQQAANIGSSYQKGKPAPRKGAGKKGSRTSTPFINGCPYIDPESFAFGQRTEGKLWNGKPVKGADGKAYAEQICEICGHHGHLKGNHKAPPQGGETTTVSTSFDERRKVFGDDYSRRHPPGKKGGRPDGVKYTGPRKERYGGKVAAVTESPKELSARVAALTTTLIDLKSHLGFEEEDVGNIGGIMCDSSQPHPNVNLKRKLETIQRMEWELVKAKLAKMDLDRVKDRKETEPKVIRTVFSPEDIRYHGQWDNGPHKLGISPNTTAREDPGQTNRIQFDWAPTQGIDINERWTFDPDAGYWWCQNPGVFECRRPTLRIHDDCQPPAEEVGNVLGISTLNQSEHWIELKHAQKAEDLQQVWEEAVKKETAEVNQPDLASEVEGFGMTEEQYDVWGDGRGPSLPSEESSLSSGTKSEKLTEARPYYELADSNLPEATVTAVELSGVILPEAEGGVSPSAEMILHPMKGTTLEPTPEIVKDLIKENRRLEATKGVQESMSGAGAARYEDGQLKEVTDEIVPVRVDIPGYHAEVAEEVEEVSIEESKNMGELDVDHEPSIEEVYEAIAAFDNVDAFDPDQTYNGDIEDEELNETLLQFEMELYTEDGDYEPMNAQVYATEGQDNPYEPHQIRCRCTETDDCRCRHSNVPGLRRAQEATQLRLILNEFREGAATPDDHRTTPIDEDDEAAANHCYQLSEEELEWWASTIKGGFNTHLHEQREAEYEADDESPKRSPKRISEHHQPGVSTPRNAKKDVEVRPGWYAPARIAGAVKKMIKANETEMKAMRIVAKGKRDKLKSPKRTKEDYRTEWQAKLDQAKFAEFSRIAEERKPKPAPKPKVDAGGFDVLTCSSGSSEDEDNSSQIAPISVVGNITKDVNGRTRRALYIEADENISVMVDTGAEVDALCGTDMAKLLLALGWFTTTGSTDNSLSFKSYTQNEIGYIMDLKGCLYFSGRALHVPYVRVCSNAPPLSILLGNYFIDDANSCLDWFTYEVKFRPTGLPPLILPMKRDWDEQDELMAAAIKSMNPTLRRNDTNSNKAAQEAATQAYADYHSGGVVKADSTAQMLESSAGLQGWAEKGLKTQDPAPEPKVLAAIPMNESGDPKLQAARQSMTQYVAQMRASVAKARAESDQGGQASVKGAGLVDKGVTNAKTCCQKRNSPYRKAIPWHPSQGKQNNRYAALEGESSEEESEDDQPIRRPLKERYEAYDPLSNSWRTTQTPTEAELIQNAKAAQRMKLEEARLIQAIRIRERTMDWQDDQNPRNRTLASRARSEGMTSLVPGVTTSDSSDLDSDEEIHRAVISLDNQDSEEDSEDEDRVMDESVQDEWRLKRQFNDEGAYDEQVPNPHFHTQRTEHNKFKYAQEKKRRRRLTLKKVRNLRKQLAELRSKKPQLRKRRRTSGSDNEPWYQEYNRTGTQKEDVQRMMDLPSTGAAHKKKEEDRDSKAYRRAKRERQEAQYENQDKAPKNKAAKPNRLSKTDGRPTSWSTSMLSLVTMSMAAAVESLGATGKVLDHVRKNATTIGMIAAVTTAGMHQPCWSPWDLEQFGQDYDLQPSQNASDIVFGHDHRSQYQYQASYDKQKQAVSMVETEYHHQDHQAAKDSGNEWVEYGTRNYTIPVMSGEKPLSLDQYVSSVRQWHKANKGADPEEVEVQVPQFNQTTATRIAAVKAQYQADGSGNTDKEDGSDIFTEVQERMDARSMQFTSPNATQSVIAAVRGTHAADQEKPMWDQMDCQSSPWCVENEQPLKKVLDRVKSLFDTTGTKPPFKDKDGKIVEVSINLVDDGPVLQRQWRLSPEKQEMLDKYLDELVERGIIQPTKYSSYATTTILVPKKGQFNPDGSQRMRVVQDYRALNRKIRKLAYTGLTAQELFDNIGDAKMFSTWDISEAFYSLKIKPSDTEKTTFWGGARGLFKYLRLPMGLSVSPQVLTHEFLDMFRVPVTINGKHYPCALGHIVMVYMDDVLAYSSRKDHLAVIDFIMTTMAKHNLVCRSDKSFIGREELAYLGMLLSAKHGISIDPSKVKACWEAPKPTDPAGVRRFLGMCGYLRAFIPNFGPSSVNLTHTLKKGKEWEWTAQCEEEYQYHRGTYCHASRRITV